MKILKFGGTSIANVTNINRVIDIILQSFKKEENVIVISALEGISGS